MGWDLSIAIEIFRHGQWEILSSKSLSEGVITPFNREESLKRARERVQENLDRSDYDNEEEWLEKVEQEAEAEAGLLDDLLFSVARNYPLFEFLARVIGLPEIKSRLGLRGLPLDTYLALIDFPHHVFSFLTLSELQTIDWKKRINRRGPTYEIKDLFPSFRDNLKGSIIQITKREFEQLDERKRKELGNRRILIADDEPIYFENIDEFLHILSLMEKIQESSNNIRMLLIFDH